MKKTKKLASLFLALVMALSVMAVTAAACGEDGHVHDEVCCEETIQPRLPSEACPYCNQAMSSSFKWVNGDRYIAFDCRTPGCQGYHLEYPYSL